MLERDINILDCTLRDGGYINDWKWGFKSSKAIIRLLAKANVDVVEVGFLRNIDCFDPNITVSNTIEELNKLLPDDFDCSKTLFSAMAMRSNYDINKLTPYNGKGIRLIRITAHDYDIYEGLEFAKQVKEKGYLLAINPINIMGYSDAEILRIIEQVNLIQPYQFSIVDTFGSMKRRDLDRIVSIVDNNLNRDIRIGLHLHENTALSYSLAQRFLDKNLKRGITIDGSLMGMGRTPGNLPIELISDYINDYFMDRYDIDYMLDAIQEFIMPLKGETAWGYTSAYFLSAKYNLHRNYAEHFLEKGDLTHRDINHLLSKITIEKATVFDSEFADDLYNHYMNCRIDDYHAREELKKDLSPKKILLLAPGKSVYENANILKEMLEKDNYTVIAVNFVPTEIKCDFVFFSNNKRFENVNKNNCKIIATSNLQDAASDFLINYNSIYSTIAQGSNSLVMLVNLLSQLGIERTYVAGADGYKEGVKNYYDDSYKSHVHRGMEYNREVAEALNKLDIIVEFVTPSEYAQYID